MRYRGKIANLEEAVQKEPQVGDVFYNTTDTHNYVWSGTEWSVLTDTVDFKMSNYELNKCVIGQMKELTPEEVDKKLEIIDNYVQESNNKYFMLLCNELNYYTVFHQCTTTFGSFTKLAKEVLDLAMKYIGNIKVIETDTNGVIAIWGWQQEKDELPHCFYLFPYGQGVVEV